MGKKIALEDMGIKKLKDELWDLFSLFIRLRDCLATCGGETIQVERKNGDIEDILVGLCFTCDRKYPLTKLQAGHFIPGRHNANLYDEKGCHAQCYGCNCGQKGMPVEYFMRMEKKYGREVIDQLYDQDKADRKFSKEEYIEMIGIYRMKVAELKKKKDEFGVWE